MENLPPFVNKGEPCKLSWATNVRFTRDGGVSNRLGFEEKADLATSAKIDDIIKLPTLGGIMFAKSGTGIFQSVNGSTWYTVGLTRTAAAREFLYSHEKDVFATNGTDNYTRIACSKVTTTFADTDVEITVDDIAQFAISGTVYIDGDAIGYTGVSGSKFTGVTGIVAGGHAAGAIVTQTSSPSGAPNGTWIAELEGSAIVGNGATVYVSNPATKWEPELFYDFSLTTGGTSKRIDSDTTAGVAGLGAVLIGTKRGMDIATGFQADAGGLLIRTLSKVHPIPNARCLCEGEREFYALTDAGRILPIMNLDTGFQVVDDPNNPRNNLDFPVQKYIRENKDPDDNSQNFIHYDPASRELTVCLLLTTGITAEFVLQRDLGAWSLDTTKTFSCKTNFKDRVYCGSDSTGKIYLDNEGVTDAGTVITSRIVTGKLRLGRKGVTGDYLLLKSGGLLNATGEFYQRIYINSGSTPLEELITADALQSDGNMDVTTGVPVGSGTVGAETIGTAGETVDAYRFDLPYEILFSAEEIQLEWEIYGDTASGTQFELRYFDFSGETEAALIVPHS
ncbi:MAG: hypothetical protein H7831_08460 [Magnetococcus sp. WYHC-3]